MQIDRPDDHAVFQTGKWRGHWGAMERHKHGVQVTPNEPLSNPFWQMARRPDGVHVETAGESGRAWTAEERA